jgi:hypothetical protein
LAPVEVVAVGQHLLGPLTFRVTTASGETLRARAVRRMHRRASPWYKVSLASLVGVERTVCSAYRSLSADPTPGAVAAVLTSRLLTYWLPVLPGIGMFRYLQHHSVI